ncbi:SAM-dependent methyltransferase [Thermobifida halotolerans]|uniref:SAM-dependent methyltransferase n=1 Tax=Thermobifida halotolerans TaxID=483545 RepID=A0A399G5B7_9ACTN|nr:SAM-dependent methyltransferase [Thermobifida halotolerans]UOE20186.1 SAM-dependent methyltransferase [Thermobifida halotolerans]
MIEQRQALPVDADPRSPALPGPRVIRMDDYRADTRAAPCEHETARAARIAEAEHRFLRRCVGYLAADLRIRQYVDFGSRVPHSRGIHDITDEHLSDARVVRIDTGTAVPLHTRASSHRSAALWIEHPRAEELVAQLGLRGLVDPGEPAAVLLDTDLLPRELPVSGVVHALHDALAPGSHLVLRQRPGNPADPYARGIAAALFEPFLLLEPGVADLAWWPYPDEEVAADGVGVLAGLARRR